MPFATSNAPQFNQRPKLAQIGSHPEQRAQGGGKPATREQALHLAQTCNLSRLAQNLDKFRNDREIVLANVSRYGNLDYASPSLRKDRELVLAALAIQGAVCISLCASATVSHAFAAAQSRLARLTQQHSWPLLPQHSH